MVKKAAKKKTGRPSKYTKKVAEKVCDLVAADPRNTMRSIAERKGMPTERTLFRWLDKHEEFRQQYARAKEIQAEHLVEEMLSIADDGSLDVELRTNRQGEEYEAERPDIVSRSKLMLDTRKWLAGKLKPKKYGDKVKMEHTGEDGGAIEVKTVKSVVERIWDENEENKQGDQ